jgi:hypothetical protein
MQYHYFKATSYTCDKMTASNHRRSVILLGSFFVAHHQVQGYLPPSIHRHLGRRKAKHLQRRAISSIGSTLGSIPSLDPNRSPPEGAEVLSEDPLVYTIPALLSPEECQAFLDRAKELEKIRPMKQSNPPEVSLNYKKLWPLPFLSLGAGIPPLIRYYDQTDGLPPMNELASIVLPSVAIAFFASLFLAFLVVLPLIQKVSESKSRTSLAMALSSEDDIPFVRDLVDRISTKTQHPWQSWEAPVFTRYTPGAMFAKHADASPARGSEWKDEGGQRVVTCICYLNDVQSGGETSFDQLGFAVAPIQGRALVFFPTVPGDSLEADERLTHESVVASNEEKYIIQMFGRVGPRVPPPLGLPDSYAPGSK